MNTTQTLKDWIATKNITIEPQLLEKPECKKHDDWRKTSYHWFYILRCEGRHITGDYWMGAAHVHPNGQAKRPTAADVIYSLCMDASACEQSFEDWCMELGYDTDSRKAKATYKECKKSGQNVKNLLGDYFELARTLEH